MQGGVQTQVKQTGKFFECLKFGVYGSDYTLRTPKSRAYNTVYLLL